MLRLINLFFGALVRTLYSRRDLFLENLALRQQLAVLHSRHRRPRFSGQDKLFWVAALRRWSGWKRVLVVVTSEPWCAGTALDFDSTGRGSRGIRSDRQEACQQGSAGTHFPHVRGQPDLGCSSHPWRVANARLRPLRTDGLSLDTELIAAMDFFTVPTLSFGVLYCFFVVAHDRRRILHFNVRRMPTSSWVVQQLREAFPYDSKHKYLIFDRDAKFGFEVIEAVKAFGSKPVRSSFHSPWQNGVAERWVGSCRRDLLDHVIVLNAKHLKRLLSATIMRILD